MKIYDSDKIRTIALVGHGQAGKTSLASAILYNTGMVNRLGRVDQGNTVTDYDEEEIERKISIQASVGYALKDDYKINFIDAPGFSNFVWEARVSLRAAETAAIIVNGVEGVEVQTEKLFDASAEIRLPVIFVINKVKKELADFYKTLDSIVESAGKNAVAVQLPIGKGLEFCGVVDLLSKKAYKYGADEKGSFQEIPVPADLSDEVESRYEELIEKIAEADETLMEKYLDEGALSAEEIIIGLKKGIINRDIFPVLAADAVANIGVAQMLDFVIKYTPSILDLEVTTTTGTIKTDKTATVSAFVFKTISDIYTGKISIMKAYSGVFKPDSSYFNTTKDVQERIGGVFFLQGKEQISAGDIMPGDVFAVAKLKETQTGDTLTIKGEKTIYPPLKFPIPSISFAIEPKSRTDENKISVALQRIMEEDPTVIAHRDIQTKELVISGNGQLHVEMVVSKMKKKYSVEVEMKPPKVPYKETIRGKADVEVKYKKQTGGRGQYAHILIKMEPLERGADFLFEETIFGGSIPRNFVPAVEKGVLEARQSGMVAGYPVVDFKVNLYDGSYHDVDSSEMAFKIAASKAFKKAMKEAKPVLLEPIMRVEVVAPQDCMGDINGNLSGRRGRIQGMESKGKNNVIKAFVPMVEMLDFGPTLTSITGGRGDYFMEFDHFEDVPGNLQKKIVEEAVKEGRVKEEED